MPKHVPVTDEALPSFEEAPSPSVDALASAESEVAFERDYSQMDLVDLIDEPAWKTILLGLVESEKMDPWNIDIAALSEKYLKKINELEGHSLRVPANAILACAILVKTKSRYLKLSSLDVEEKRELTEEQRQLMLEEIPDLLSARSAREGRISLDELVASIEDIIQATSSRKATNRQMPRMEITFDPATIEERMEEVFTLIHSKVDSQGIVLFRDLVTGADSEGVVGTFLPVLFLMNNGKILAYQNDFFGDIFIKVLPTDSTKESGGEIIHEVVPLDKKAKKKSFERKITTA